VWACREYGDEADAYHLNVMQELPTLGNRSDTYNETFHIIKNCSYRCRLLRLDCINSGDDRS